jgi:Tfp pilus assembly protein PilN
MIEVNLNPEAGRKKRRRRSIPSTGGLAVLREGLGGRDPWITAAVAVATIVVIGCGFLWLRQRSANARIADRLAAATADSTRVSDLRAVSDSLMQQRSAISERLALVQQLDGGRFVWPHLMDEISRALPDYAWLTLVKRVSAPSGLRVEIQGIAAAPLVITDFIRNLESSPFIDQVQIKTTSLQEIEGLAAQGFTLEVNYARRPRSRAGDTQPLIGAGS